MANLKRKIRLLKLCLKENGSTYLHFFIYIVISSGFIISNKLLLSSKEINFRYPFGLGFLQTAFSSVLCFLTMKVMKIRRIEDPRIWKIKEGMSMREYACYILPIGITFALSLLLRNGAYLYVSVPLMQVIKTTLPVAVFVLGLETRFEAMKSKMLLYMSAIIIGVIVASYGEARFSWIGLGYQIGSIIIEGLRLLFVEDLVLEEEGGVQPISVRAMYYNSLCSSLFLFPPWILFEMLKVESFWPWGFSVPCIVIINCLLMFAINLQACLVISRTSALRFAQTKAVRDLIVIHLSPSFFPDMALTTTSIFGYYIALASLVMHYPLKKEALIRYERAHAFQQSTSRRRVPPSRVTLEEKARARMQVLLGDVP